MRWRRMLLDTIGLAGLGLALGLVGVSAALPLSTAFAHALGIESLAFTSDEEPGTVSVAFGLACALAAIAAWLLGLLHRGVLREPPSGLALVAGTALLVLAIPLGLAWQLFWMRGALAGDPGGIALVLTPTSLELDGCVTRMVLRVSALIGAGLAIRARRRAPP